MLTPPISMIITIFKFFVEKIYYEAVSYNRAYDKSTGIELSDIRSRQFVVVLGMIGFVLAFSAFCFQRYFVDINLNDYPGEFAVEMAIDVFLAISVVRKLNKLGIYEDAISKVESMDKKQLIRFRWRSMLIGSGRIVSFLVVIYGTRYLLITYF